MVSHIEHPDQLVPRRPSSVTSRASTSRRHRSSRSYHGSSSSTSQNEFPIFSHTGEVDIIIASANGRQEQRYLLHRLILSQCSAFFETDLKHDTFSTGPLARIGDLEKPRTSIDSTAPVRLTSSSKTSSTFSEHKRWRYVLDWPNTLEGHVPILVQREPLPSVEDSPPGPPPVSRNKPPPSSSSFFRSMSNFSALNLNSQPNISSGPDDEVLRDYDNLFRIFYNYTPTLDSVNIANAYTECKALLHLADTYDALDVVGPRIDHHLLRFQGRLFKQIAKYPPSYLKLAWLARSKVIFAEAMIHIVGQWPLAAPQLRGQVDLSVMDLIEDKVDELDEIKAKVEAKLFRLTLTTSRGERVTPTNSYLDWLAMSLFRQWIAENTTPPPVSILKDSSPRPGSGHTVSSPNERAPAPSSSGRSPSSRTRSSSSSRHNTHHPSQSQALVSTRHVPPPPPYSPTGSSQQTFNSGRIYRLLGSTINSAYLAHDELKRFLKLSPDLYTRENLRRFERRMDELKNLARDAVRPLTRNCLELDLGSLTTGNGGSGGGSLGYLTCTRILNEDFPWDD